MCPQNFTQIFSRWNHEPKTIASRKTSCKFVLSNLFAYVPLVVLPLFSQYLCCSSYLAEQSCFLSPSSCHAAAGLGNPVVFYLFVPLVKRQWRRLLGKLAGEETGDVGEAGPGRGPDAGGRKLSWVHIVSILYSVYMIV